MTILIFLSIGVFVPQSRFTMLYSSFVHLAFGGVMNGFISCALMKFYGASDWRYAATSSALMLPCAILPTVLLVDLIDYIEKSNQLFPFTSFVFAAVLWAAINIPSSHMGSYLAWTRADVTKPAPVSAIRRRVPPLPMHLEFKGAVCLASILIFTAAIAPFHQIMTSVWRSQLIGAFALLLVNLLLICVITSLISVIHTYLALQAQDWQWQWRAWWSGFASSFMLFNYTAWVLIELPAMDIASYFVVGLYALTACGLFGLLCGAASLLAS